MCDNMDKTGGLYAEWNHPVSEGMGLLEIVHDMNKEEKNWYVQKQKVKKSESQVQERLFAVI